MYNVEITLKSGKEIKGVIEDNNLKETFKAIKNHEDGLLTISKSNVDSKTYGITLIVSEIACIDWERKK